MPRSVRLIAFDWDGTAVDNRRSDAGRLAALLERLLDAGIWIVIVTGTTHRNILDQLCVYPRWRGVRRLVVCASRGSEVFGFDDHEPVSRYRRQASPDEDARLTAVMRHVQARLRDDHGLETTLVLDRLNRRKLDLIPLPGWEDPPKSRIGDLRQAVDQRLRSAGVNGGLADVVALAKETMCRHGLADACLTSDAKHVELGLTDKADSMRWVVEHVMEPARMAPSEVILGGDEFGPVGATSGSDARMMIPELAGATVISVGPEPYGVPDGVRWLPGGPPRFLDLLDRVLDGTFSSGGVAGV